MLIVPVQTGCKSWHYRKVSKVIFVFTPKQCLRPLSYCAPPPLRIHLCLKFKLWFRSFHQNHFLSNNLILNQSGAISLWHETWQPPGLKFFISWNCFKFQALDWKFYWALLAQLRFETRTERTLSFFSTSLPLASARWVCLTLSSLCPLF